MAEELEPRWSVPAADFLRDAVKIVDAAVDANAPHGENPELIDEDDER